MGLLAIAVVRTVLLSFRYQTRSARLLYIALLAGWYPPSKLPACRLGGDIPQLPQRLPLPPFTSPADHTMQDRAEHRSSRRKPLTPLASNRLACEQKPAWQQSIADHPVSAKKALGPATLTVTPLVRPARIRTRKPLQRSDKPAQLFTPGSLTRLPGLPPRTTPKQLPQPLSGTKIPSPNLLVYRETTLVAGAHPSPQHGGSGTWKGPDLVTLLASPHDLAPLPLLTTSASPAVPPAQQPHGGYTSAPRGFSTFINPEFEVAAQHPSSQEAQQQQLAKEPASGSASLRWMRNALSVSVGDAQPEGSIMAEGSFEVSPGAEQSMQAWLNADSPAPGLLQSDCRMQARTGVAATAPTPANTPVPSVGGAWRVVQHLNGESQGEPLGESRWPFFGGGQRLLFAFACWCIKWLANGKLYQNCLVPCRCA